MQFYQDDLPAAMAEITGGDGFDFALECIGLPSTCVKPLTLRRGGTACVVGAGRMEETLNFPLLNFFFRRKNIGQLLLWRS